jgi:SAM-dependent methyltransferase
METEIEFYDRIGYEIGWDFSKIEPNVEDVTWELTDEVKKFKGNKVLLDLGTGGGKKLLSLADDFKCLIGIDNSEGMITTANKNRNKENVRFILCSFDKVPLPDNSFDVIMARHAPFSVKEVSRLLKQGGIFITQQVGEKDKINIKEIFGRGQNFGEQSGEAVENSLNEFKSNGYEIVKKERYDATEYYKDMGDILFLLENTPIIPNFDRESDKENLLKFEQEFKSEKGVKTNSERFLLIVRKV